MIIITIQHYLLFPLRNWKHWIRYAKWTLAEESPHATLTATAAFAPLTAVLMGFVLRLRSREGDS